MFQRTLILAAISAAFAQFIPTPCQIITNELQKALGPEDPKTFPIISDFNYTFDHIRILFDFFDLTFEGFSNVNCTSFYVSEQESVAILNLIGHNLEFNTSHADIDINQPGFLVPIKTNFTSHLVNYTLELRFEIDSYREYPFNLCITSGSLNMTFHADGICNNVEVSPDVTQELNDHPEEVVEAINHYLPRFANDLTAILNDLLCHAIPLPTWWRLKNHYLPRFANDLTTTLNNILCQISSPLTT
ncbi:uncharacterized protein [Palaemon carinicauda]|uniref:uncharacterized protein n=1 Tax=Palaemon carinicauda TaxID=392227 RepID=UPI0035B5A723